VFIEVWLSGSEPTILRRSALGQQELRDIRRKNKFPISSNRSPYSTKVFHFSFLKSILQFTLCTKSSFSLRLLFSHIWHTPSSLSSVSIFPFHFKCVCEREKERACAACAREEDVSPWSFLEQPDNSVYFCNPSSPPIFRIFSSGILMVSLIMCENN